MNKSNIIIDIYRILCYLFDIHPLTHSSLHPLSYVYASVSMCLLSSSSPFIFTNLGVVGTEDPKPEGRLEDSSVKSHAL